MRTNHRAWDLFKMLAAKQSSVDLDALATRCVKWAKMFDEPDAPSDLPPEEVAAIKESLEDAFTRGKNEVIAQRFARIDKLGGLVRTAEWRGNNPNFPMAAVCPWCDRPKQTGHDTDCAAFSEPGVLR